MNTNKKKNLVSQTLLEVAPRIGARILLESEYGFAGQVTYKSGVRRYFRGSSLDINRLGASETAKDKAYANFFMAKLGYPTIEGETFLSDDFCAMINSDRNIDAGYEYAQALGWPVVVKPNSKSQGSGVAMVTNKRDFYRAMKEALEIDRVVLVQRTVTGRDYRIVVLDGKVISAYERIPLFVVGDGVSTISKLLGKKQLEFEKTGRDTRIKFNDYRMKIFLGQKKLTLKSIVPKGERLQLLSNANLSSGGDSVEVTSVMSSDFKRIAAKLARDMGLRLCGVDLMIDGDITTPAGRYWVIEINSAPGLDNYSALGPKQARVVKQLYLKVLKAMEK